MLKFFRILFFLLFSYQVGFTQAYWEKIKTPTDFDLKKISYLDSLHCWVGGDSGVILFSGDGGSTWVRQYSDVTNYISDIFFLNDTLGWAVTFELENFEIRGKILKSIDGGSNWEKINFRHLNVILNTIYFQDELKGWIGSKPGGIYFTEDGGYNWSEATIDTGSFSNFPVEQINFSTPQYGFAVGGHVDAVGVCWSSSDGGNIWKPHGIGPDMFIDYVFIDSVTVVSLTAELEGYYPTALLKFSLLDNTWTYIDTPEYVYVTGLKLRTNTEIWGTIKSNSSNFIFSKNSGESWQLINLAETPKNLIAIDLDFADSLHGIAVCKDGFILRYIPEKLATVGITDYKVIKDYKLEQNYPNPFNPATKIQYSLSNRQFVTIKIYDLLGREVATLVNEEKPAGIYEAEFNVGQNPSDNIASGIYIYQLKTENYITSKKMLLLK